MRSAGWRRITLIAVVAVIIIGGATTGVLLWLSHSHAQSVKAYKAATSADWKKVVESADNLTAAMLRVSSPTDLAAVQGGAAQMKGLVTDLTRALERKGPPSGYQKVGDSESVALASLGSYLDKLASLSSQASSETVSENSQVLADLARKAQDDTSEFESQATWIKSSVPNDLYGGIEALQAAFLPSKELEAQAQQVFDTMQTFMNADIVQRNFDVIWSLFDSRLHTGFDYYKITKEKLAADWEKAWDGKPVAFYVSRSQISFPSPGNATVKVIAYMDNEGPRIEEFRLVNEGGTWKLDDDPFVGFL
jgi:hypothetical protein